MIRDMDAVRDILLAVEQHSGDPRKPLKIKLPGKDPLEVSYHVELLAEANLVEAIDFSTMGTHHWEPKRLTWAGHEFLDSIRDPAIWKRTKEGASKVGGFGVELLGELAKGLIRQQIKHHTGVEI